MKVAIYPGSFNPFHEGHLDVIKQALKLFDKVVIAKGLNPEKPSVVSPLTFSSPSVMMELKALNEKEDKVPYESFMGLLKDYIENSIVHSDGIMEYAVIKGLRNGQDLEYEKNQQYWNEDLGIEIPFFYIISDRKYCHISSSAIRGLAKFREVEDG